MHGIEQFSILKLCGICQSTFGLSLEQFQTDSSYLQHEKCHFFTISALILDKEKLQIGFSQKELVDFFVLFLGSFDCLINGEK